ncbi:hypothetical protein ACQ4WP_28490 [Janthinobacterium sp. GB4P2]
MKRLITVFAIYCIWCSILAFVDVDWDAKSELTVKDSMYKQTLYMSRPQLKVYFNDLDTIDSASMMGGVKGNFLDGKEVSDIHELANRIRSKKGQEAIDYPSKPFIDSVRSFFVIPFQVWMSRD